MSIGDLMDILYISSVCSKDKFNKLFEKAKIKPAQQLKMKGLQ